MHSAIPFRVILCDEWGATPPTGALTVVGKPDGSIFHHTAGHVPNLGAGETYAEACAYARAIQKFHKAQGWIDSGHNYLVTRGGFILEGRRRSHALCMSGRMVRSAHCPGQNDNPGVEHEHIDPEKMTPIERQASIWLHAKLCRAGGFGPNKITPHRAHFATACPGTLVGMLPDFREDVAKELKPVASSERWWDAYGPATKPPWFFAALREYARRLDE